MLGCEFLHGICTPFLCSHRPFASQGGMSRCCGVWWTQFWVRRGLEEALVGMEGGNRGHFHVGSLGESAARGHYSASHQPECCSPRGSPAGRAQCWAGVGRSGVTRLHRCWHWKLPPAPGRPCHDFCPWAWQPGSQPSPLQPLLSWIGGQWLVTGFIIHAGGTQPSLKSRLWVDWRFPYNNFY